MPMRTEQHFYREYEIQITHNPPGWQAAIYPTRKGLPRVDWEQLNIGAVDPAPALQLAKSTIDKTLARAR
jgi:hypothetical protein